MRKNEEDNIEDRKVSNMENDLKIPRHVAVILDGNGRWAKAKGMPRTFGHAQGAKVVEDMLEVVDKKGIEYFTVYAFSTENWNRPKDEVDVLMKLLRKHMIGCIKRAAKNNMRVLVIGDKTKLDEDIKKSIEEVEEVTKNNTGLHFQVAINYGGRDEMIRAMRKMAADIKKDKVQPEEINEEKFQEYLDTYDCPDPDLMIRTSGEQRLSNFLLWQMAYTEFYFTDVAWPDFNEAELDRAILAYNKRNRRYGGIK